MSPLNFRVSRPEAVHRAAAGDSLKLASLRVTPWRPARPLVAEEGDSTKPARPLAGRPEARCRGFGGESEALSPTRNLSFDNALARTFRRGKPGAARRFSGIMIPSVQRLLKIKYLESISKPGRDGPTRLPRYCDIDSCGCFMNLGCSIGNFHRSFCPVISGNSGVVV